MYFRLVLPCNWSIWKGAHVNTSQIDFLCDFKLKVWVKMFNKGFAEKNTDSRTLVLMLCFPMKERQLRIIIFGYMYSFDTIHTKFIWLQEMITFNQVRDNEFGPFTLVVKTLYIKLEIFKHCSCLVGTLGIFCIWKNIRVLSNTQYSYLYFITVLELRITQYK